MHLAEYIVPDVGFATEVQDAVARAALRQGTMCLMERGKIDCNICPGDCPERDAASPANWQANKQLLRSVCIYIGLGSSKVDFADHFGKSGSLDCRARSCCAVKRALIKRQNVKTAFSGDAYLTR